MTDAGDPRYRRLAEEIRDEIIEGELAPGQMLPSLRVMAATHKVGVDTVREAFKILRAEGLIVTEHGYGSYVREIPPKTVLQVTAGSRISTRTPSQRERAEMNLPEGVALLIVNGTAYPGDRYDVEVVEQSSE